jgi:hypothetical protein
LFTENGGGNYRMDVSGRKTNPDVVLAYYDRTASKWEKFNTLFPDPPLKAGDEFDMELFAIGNKLIGRFNGKQLPIVTDTRLTEGNLGFQTADSVRDVEVLNLDGLSEAEALKLAGVADAPAAAP